MSDQRDQQNQQGGQGGQQGGGGQQSPGGQRRTARPNQKPGQGGRRAAVGRSPVSSRAARLLFGEFFFLALATGLSFSLPPGFFLRLARDRWLDVEKYPPGTS